MHKLEPKSYDAQVVRYIQKSIKNLCIANNIGGQQMNEQVLQNVKVGVTNILDKMMLDNSIQEFRIDNVDITGNEITATIKAHQLTPSIVMNFSISRADEENEDSSKSIWKDLEDRLKDV